MKPFLIIFLLWGVSFFSSLLAQQVGNTTISYKVETLLAISDGNTTPMWLSANKNGLLSQKAKQAYLTAGIYLNKRLKNDWSINTELEIAGGKNLTSSLFVQQAYADINWKTLELCIGAKERQGFPLNKDLRISSGMMVEGSNARPIPQIRASVRDFTPIPFIGEWIAFKGHLAYGWCTDGNWQEEFAGVGQYYLKNVLYHSKSLALRIGNNKKIPLALEVGLLDIAQFGGEKYLKNANNEHKLIQKYPTGIKSYWKAFFPKQESTLANVEGNHSGSWSASLTYYGKDWSLRTYLEHYFEDHSQMFMEYGLWKDGQIGIELTLPSNLWINKILWEGLNTTDQTGPILYDGIAGSFSDIQISGGDNYFNNGQYMAWQHWGMGMTNPLIPGPIYNTDGKIIFRSSRVKANHIGIYGHPEKRWDYRLLASYVKHWGTYPLPLNQIKKQFSGMVEMTYTPSNLKGWSLSLAIAIDRGNFLGNSNGGMISLKKVGIWEK